MTKFSIGTFILFCTFSTGFAQNSGAQFYSLGYQQWKQGNFREAIKLYTWGIEFNDVFKGKNLYGRAYCYFELYELDSSSADVNLILDSEYSNSNQLNSNSYSLKALLSYLQDDLDSEVRFWRKAIEYDSTNNRILNGYGISLIELEKYKEGIQVLNQVILSDVNHAFAYTNRAFGYLKIGKKKLAISDLERSFELDKENPFLYSGLFRYYLAVNKRDLACDFLSTGMEKPMRGYGYEKDKKIFLGLWNEHCNN